MCIEYDRAPTTKPDTYLSLCFRPLNASSFVGVGVGVGVTSIPIKAITLAPPVPLGELHILHFPLTSISYH